MSIDRGPGLPAPTNALWPPLTSDDAARERLRRARIGAAAALALALLLGVGWFLDRREPDLDPRVRAQVDQALESWRQVQVRAAAGQTITDDALLAAGVQPNAVGVRESLETVRDSHEAPQRYFVNLIRTPPGDAVLVEASWGVHNADAAYSWEQFVTFVRDERGQLRMVACTPDVRDGI
ncbi:hypothetical protein GCM10009547_15700 [Sporichthya brevicatena]|uniref:Uncharacterized protein n=1 Tax=Sporichthya brevicatena TaxID=171442 RepID=A0ABN1GMP2_9ACTN